MGEAVRSIIVAGSRGFKDYPFLRNILHAVIDEGEKGDEVEIVSGGAKGADSLGEVYAKEFGYSTTKFPANWKKYGRAAGYIRNEEMAEYAAELVVFWDGRSSGTKHMVQHASKKGLKVKLFFHEACTE
ncbi:MAG: DUF2493 domain-containing protein [Aureispira sp.]|nr:DUF2493 domain-containing protein [Aureispira sp.]